jgi:hypothetical protein
MPATHAGARIIAVVQFWPLSGPLTVSSAKRWHGKTTALLGRSFGPTGEMNCPALAPDEDALTWFGPFDRVLDAAPAGVACS